VLDRQEQLSGEILLESLELGAAAGDDDTRDGELPVLELAAINAHAGVELRDPAVGGEAQRLAAGVALAQPAIDMFAHLGLHGRQAGGLGHRIREELAARREGTREEQPVADADGDFGLRMADAHITVGLFMRARELFHRVIERDRRGDQIGRAQVVAARRLDDLLDRGGARHRHDVAPYASFEGGVEREDVMRHLVAGHLVELSDVHRGDLLGRARVVVHDAPALEDGLRARQGNRAELLRDPELVYPGGDQLVRIVLVHRQGEGFRARHGRPAAANAHPDGPHGTGADIKGNHLFGARHGFWFLVPGFWCQVES